MNAVSVRRKGHGTDEWIRKETPNARSVGSKHSGFFCCTISITVCYTATGVLIA